MTCRGCEGTYRIRDGEVTFGQGFGDTEAEAKKAAEDDARKTIDLYAGMSKLLECCDEPCENPPWFRLTTAAIDTDAEEWRPIEGMSPRGAKTRYFGRAVILWSLDMSCRKPLPPARPGEHRPGVILASAEPPNGALIRDVFERIRSALSRS